MPHPTVSQSSPATVVIVSADEIERQRLASLARAVGHTVIALESGAQTLARFAPPARLLLVVDHVLHDMRPQELIEMLQQRGLFVPTLMTVPPRAVDQAVGGLRLGAKDVLEKPFGEKRLLQAIEQALRKP